VQYSIENLFAVRKTGFKDHAGVIQELDLVELDDQLTHPFDMDIAVDGEDRLNVFKEDPFYEKTEQ
jgi:pre-mRNA-splicing factor CWC22